MLRWWFDDDRIGPGQWFKGRIYERRCDLSPDGDLLIYFAAKWRGPLETWTAVSRTPYLTALALWPKGDAWGGGGLFDSPKTIGLNHLTLDAPVLPGAPAVRWHPLGREAPVLPVGYQVQRWSEHAGRGEDNPVHHERITRDGWVFVAEGDEGPYRRSEYAWLFSTPEIYERRSPKGGPILRRLLRAIYQTNGPWYVEDFEVLSDGGAWIRFIPGCSWADWQANGDLLFGLEGKLYRLADEHARRTASDPLQDAKCIADLAPLRFQAIAAPDWAKQWP